jgi:predicted amidophosphoribosyltransferase
MEQAPSAGNGEAQVSALARSWDAWEEYYRQAALRRREHRGRRHLRQEKRRRRLRERIGLAISAALVGGLTLVFYLVLTR